MTSGIPARWRFVHCPGRELFIPHLGDPARSALIVERVLRWYRGEATP